MSQAHTAKPHPSMVSGLLISFVLAIAGIQLGKIGWFPAHGFSALTIAIVLGMLVGNTLYPMVAKSCAHGVGFSKAKLLRAGIVLFGLRLTFQNVADVGWAGIIIDTIIVGVTFILAVVLGTRLFGMDRKAAMLIGAGSAICGAAAVMAAEPVVRGRAEQVTVAVATVVIFGTIGIFLYPFLYSLHLSFLPASPAAFGIYEGSTIHEVAQVAAAAQSTDPLAASTGVITKMVRVMMLAPFLIMLSAWLARDPEHQKDSGHVAGQKSKIVIPWFAFGFIGVVLLNSVVPLHQAISPWVQYAIDFDTLLLSMAMAALGLSTHLSAIRQAGIKPILLAGILFVWLVVGGAFVNNIVNAFFAHL